MNTQFPKVSVVIPLYRSAQFLPVIIENVRTIDYPCVEIIISDRHCLDTSTEELQYEFRNDQRVRVVKSKDGIGWVAHFNALVRMATGDYLVWMQHDDTFPADYLHKLVANAAIEPKPAVTYGTIHGLWLNQAETETADALPALPSSLRWTMSESLRLLFTGCSGVPFRGLIRRATLQTLPDLMIDTRKSCGTEGVWIFALGLCGPLRFVHDCSCIKRIHADSATRRVNPGPLDFLDQVRAMAWYARNYPMSRLAGIVGTLAVLGFSLLQIVYHFGMKRGLRRAQYLRCRDFFRACLTRHGAHKQLDS